MSIHKLPSMLYMKSDFNKIDFFLTLIKNNFAIRHIKGLANHGFDDVGKIPNTSAAQNPETARQKRPGLRRQIALSVRSDSGDAIIEELVEEKMETDEPSGIIKG